MNAIIEMEDVEFGEWIEFSNSPNAISPDEISVSFAPKKNGHLVMVRLGTDVLKKMKWKQGDKLIMLINKNDKYKWAFAAASKGYKIGCDNNVKSCKRIQITWPYEGVTYTKARKCRYETDKEKLIIHIPM